MVVTLTLGVAQADRMLNLTFMDAGEKNLSDTADDDKRGLKAMGVCEGREREDDWV